MVRLCLWGAALHAWSPCHLAALDRIAGSLACADLLAQTRSLSVHAALFCNLLSHI